MAMFRSVILSITFFVASCIVSNAQLNFFPLNDPVGIGTSPNGPLNKLHIHLNGENIAQQPVLRFSYGGLPPTDFQPIAQLAFCSTTQNALLYSKHAAAGDLTIRTASTAGGENGNGRLILSSQHPNGAILFTTTKTAAPVGFDAADHVRMRITSQGHVGIWENDPKELLHIGSRMTFHVGYEDDYLGYNVYRDAANVDRLITGTTSQNGYALKYGMSRHGYLEIGAGSTANGLAGQTVDWNEGGSAFSAFAGLTIRNIDGKGCASFGKYYPVPNCRVFIKAFYDSSTITDALVAVSSNHTDLFRVRNNGGVGIAQANPKERLHIGNLMTFHDGGGKFMGFNAYWDDTDSQMKNIELGRISVTMGIGPGSSSPFAIQVDKNDTTVQIMSSVFKGLSITSSGKVGVGTLSPKSRLHVLGDVTIGEKRCTTAATGFNSRLSVDGIIFAKEIIVTTPDYWADHVFSDDYSLMPLHELQKFITDNKHLPGMPTEREVAERGVSVSTMQVKLLEKVEQLTLYVLELAKRNEDLQSEVRMLRETR